MKKRVFVIAGVLVSVALLAVVLHTLEWDTFLRAIRGVDPTWLGLTVFCSAGGVALRAFRWQWIAGGRPGQFTQFWGATNLGVLANQLFPARAGEVLRIAIIHRTAAVPLGSATFSAVYDRLTDVALLVLAGSAVIAAHSDSILKYNMVASALAVVLGFAVAGALFGRFGHRFPRGVTVFFAGVSERLTRHFQQFYAETLHAAGTMFDARRLLGLLIITSLVFLLDYGALLGALKAFGWQLPAMAPVTIWVFLALATALPSAPGFLGLYQVACILALAQFGINQSPSIAFALVFQGTTIGTVAILTAISYLQKTLPRSVLAEIPKRR